MSNLFTKQVRILTVSVCSLFIIVLLSACQGVVTSNGNGYSSNGTAAAGSNYITGQIVSVDTQAHSVTLLVNGQQFTVSGLNDQQTAALQSQINQTYKFQLTQAIQSGTTAYTINQNTQPQEESNTSSASTTSSTSSSASNSSGTPVQGNIEFAGHVQSVNGSNVVVSTPDGQNLTVTVITNQANSTDLSDMKGMQLSSGQVVKVKAMTDQSGNFVATKVGIDKLNDQQKDLMTVQYLGVTTSAVGADNRINFKVGNKSYSFPIATNGMADLKDFNNNAQNIGNNVVVKVKVTFNGTNGTATDISNPNN